MPFPRTAPQRRRAASAVRPVSTVLLVLGSVLAVAAAFGPLPIARAGVAVALIAAVGSSVLSWRELRRERRRHAAETLSASRAHGRALRDERRHNQHVLQVVTDRNVRAVAEIERQQLMIGGLRAEVTTLRGDRQALQGQLVRRDRLIERLRDDVADRDAELAERVDTTSETGDPAVVRSLPRRVLVLDETHGAGDVWPDRARPSAAELVAQVPVLPNYEEDRRPA